MGKIRLEQYFEKICLIHNQLKMIADETFGQALLGNKDEVSPRLAALMKRHEELTNSFEMLNNEAEQFLIGRK